MTPEDGAPPIPDPMRLLERAVGYALSTLRDVTSPVLRRPTPCADWDVRLLLHLVTDSLDALCEGTDSGHIGPVPVAPAKGDAPAQLVAALRDRALRLLSACGAAGQHNRIISVGDMPLTTRIMAGVGAIEVAAHGWDISQACGKCQPIPPALAVELLAVAQVFVPRSGRRCLFAEPVAVPVEASPSDRLIAYLGRSPA
jgi:uncharacterized protein (TIGR03086 family)